VLSSAALPQQLAYQSRLIRDCEATYDEMAEDYVHHLLHDCSYRSPGHVAAAIAELEPQGRWLDLGAGTGLVGDEVFELGLHPSLIAVDVSAAMLDQIACPLYIERHQADVLSRLPVPPRSCQGAFAAGLMEYVLDVPSLMRRTAEAIVPGGWFVFTFCPSEHDGVRAFDAETDLHCHDVRLVERCLADAGFRVHGAEEFPAYVNGEQGWIRHRMVRAQLG